MPSDVSGMYWQELDQIIERLHQENKREEVVAFLRKYGLFTDEEAVHKYLAGEVG